MFSLVRYGLLWPCSLRGRSRAQVLDIPRSGVEAWGTPPNAGDRAALRHADARPAAGPAPRPRSAESFRSRSASPRSGSRRSGPCRRRANAPPPPSRPIVADEQAALRRVTMLVAQAAPPEAVFAAVAAGAGRLLGVVVVVLVRYDLRDSITVVGGWTSTGAAAPIPVSSRLPLGGDNVTT